MSIYKKLASARVMLQSENLKKSGKNKHLGFEYMELDDFLPTVNKINSEVGLTPVFSITDTGATLTIFDHETDASITFTSPVAHAKLQGNASPIQELGSQHTYMRRYKYLLAYEITEHDALDSQIGQPEPPKQQPKPTKEQPKPRLINTNESLDLLTLCSQKGTDISKLLRNYGLSNLESMTVDILKQAVAILNKKEDVA